MMPFTLCITFNFVLSYFLVLLPRVSNMVHMAIMAASIIKSDKIDLKRSVDITYHPAKGNVRIKQYRNKQESMKFFHLLLLSIDIFLFRFRKQPPFSFLYSMTVYATFHFTRLEGLAFWFVLCPEPVSRFSIVTFHFIHWSNGH